MELVEEKVAAIIVNYNLRNLVSETINSIISSDWDNLEIIFIDNNSNDESVSHVRKYFRKIHIIENKKNLGFAHGCNQGIEKASEIKADFVLFINSDATVENNTIGVLVKLLQDKENAVAAAPFIFYHKNPKMIWYGGGKVALWRAWVGHRNIRKHFNKEEYKTAETDYLTGCIFLAKTNAMVNIRGFSLDYIIYSEDVDLSLKLKKLGLTIWVTPEAKGFHRISASAGGELHPFKSFHRGRSTVILLSRFSRIWEYPTVILGGFIGAVFISLKLLLKGKSGTIYALWWGIIAGLLHLKIPSRFKLGD